MRHIHCSEEKVGGINLGGGEPGENGRGGKLIKD